MLSLIKRLLLVGIAWGSLSLFSRAGGQTDVYLIHPQDTLDIKVWRNPDLDTEIEVDPQGNIRLPLLGKIKVSSLTIPQLEEKLTLLWGKNYIRNPYVRVYIRKKKIYVIGEVKEPGDFELEGKVTVLKAISMAGGFTDYAAKGKVLVLRGSGAEAQKIKVDTSEIEKGRAPDPELQPGDVVTVPQSLF
jgi:polysaccharide export outer membrane protein